MQYLLRCSCHVIENQSNQSNKNKTRWTLFLSSLIRLFAFLFLNRMDECDRSSIVNHPLMREREGVIQFILKVEDNTRVMLMNEREQTVQI